MAKVKFYINVDSVSELTNNEKLELLRKFKESVTVVKKEYPDINIIVGRELTNEDIMESLRGIPEDPDVDDCRHYDEAQGRHKCIHPLVIGHRCHGLCEYYEEIE